MITRTDTVAATAIDDATDRGESRPGQTRSVKAIAGSAKMAAVTSNALVAILLTSLSVRADPSVFPTATTRYDPQKAYNSYILFSGADEKTHLVDMTGGEVHRWDHQGFPSTLLDPRLTGGKPGHVLVQTETVSDTATGTTPGQASLFRNKTIAELDWDGSTVWQWGDKAPGGAERQHHDWSRLGNGNTLVLASLDHPVAGFTLPSVQDDVIYEVAPGGDIVWRWVASEHLDELGFSADELALVRKSPSADYFHVNNMKPLGPNHWFDAGDQRFHPENVIIDSRNANFIAIIDKKTGKVVWHLGPHFALPAPGAKAGLPRPVDQISGQHDAHLIPAGLPGAGNLLVFDNQGEAGYPPVPLKVFPASRVLEINPVTQEIVWSYSGDDSGRPAWSFHSSFISNARRLPNGNTFIDEGMNGRFFQVTPQGDIVWEYVSPYFGRSVIGSEKRKVSSNFVYRAQPVPYDWVPAGTPHAENAVVPPDPASYRVPAAH